MLFQHVYRVPMAANVLIVTLESRRIMLNSISCTCTSMPRVCIARPVNNLRRQASINSSSVPRDVRARNLARIGEMSERDLERDSREN